MQPGSHPKHKTVAFAKRARFQVITYLVVLLSTVGPYNGINALGGAGMEDHLIATKMNSVYALCFAVCGWLGGAAFNWAGARVVCCLGSVCYFCCIATLGAVSEGLIAAPWALLAGMVLGVGASLIWSAFGVFSIRYPRAKHQARCFQWMWASVNLGGSCIGFVSLLMNMDPAGDSTRANSGSYLALALVTFIGSVLAGVLIVHQREVVKTDGHHVESHTCLSAKKAVADAVAAISHPQMRHLIPLFVVPAAHMPFLFNGINSQFFNIRSRSLNSCLYWLARVPGGFAFHGLVKLAKRCHLPRDDPCIARKLLPGLYLTYIWASFTLILAFVSIYNIFGILEPPAELSPTIDIFDNTRGAVLPCSLFVMFGLTDSLSQAFIYSLVASLAGSNTEEAAVFSGFYKSLQSLGLAVFWTLDWQTTGPLQYVQRYKMHWWLVTTVWIASFPGSLLTLLRLRSSLGPQDEENSDVESE